MADFHQGAMKIFQRSLLMLQAWIFLHIRKWVKPEASMTASALFDMTLPRSQLMLGYLCQPTPKLATVSIDCGLLG